MKFKFKCIRTDQVFEFEEQDVKGMRSHPDYVEVKEEEEKKPATKPAKKDKED